MTKDELRVLNVEPIEMLVAMRDRIDQKLDELGAAEDGGEGDAPGFDEDDEG